MRSMQSLGRISGVSPKYDYEHCLLPTSSRFSFRSTTASFDREKILPARISHFPPSVYIDLRLHPTWEKHQIGTTCLVVTRKQDLGGEGGPGLPRGEEICRSHVYQ